MHRVPTIMVAWASGHSMARIISVVQIMKVTCTTNDHGVIRYFSTAMWFMSHIDGARHKRVRPTTVRSYIIGPYGQRQMQRVALRELMLAGIVPLEGLGPPETPQLF